MSRPRCARVLSLILITLALALSAHASFSNASLNASYSFLTNLRTANTATNQFAMVGVMTFDGVGNMTGSYTSISRTTVHSGALAGTYVVNADGTGTLTFTTPSTAQFTITLNSTAAGLAHSVQLLQINDSKNEIVSGTAMLQSATATTYTVASLKGTFALQYTPWAADATLAEDGGQAIFTFDGKGNIKFSVITVFKGQVFKNSGSFVYTVNADGTGTIVPPSGGKGPQMAFALNTVTSGQAKGLQFLDTNTSDGPGNLVISGIILKQ